MRLSNSSKKTNSRWQALKVIALVKGTNIASIDRFNLFHSSARHLRLVSICKQIHHFKNSTLIPKERCYRLKFFGNGKMGSGGPALTRMILSI